MAENDPRAFAWARYRLGEAPPASLLYNARKYARLTREELSILTGLSATTIFDMEAGTIDPRWSAVLKILSACRITLGVRRAGKRPKRLSRAQIRAWERERRLRDAEPLARRKQRRWLPQADWNMEREVSAPPAHDYRKDPPAANPALEAYEAWLRRRL